MFDKNSLSKILTILLTLTVLLVTACTTAVPPSSDAGSGGSDGSTVPPTNIAAMENIRGLLARQLHMDPATIQVVSAEAVEWTDSCLGLGGPAESCMTVSTPGYKIVLSANGEQYIYHTDSEGYRYRMAETPAPAMGEMRMAWGGTFDNGECMESLIGPDGVAFGGCGDQPKITGQFASDARLNVLNEWVSHFNAFDAETDFGSVRLQGTGTAVPTPEEEQMIGRWAQMVSMEAAAGESRAGMSYQGPAEMGSSDTSKCTIFQLNTAIEAGVGLCDGSMQYLDMGKRTYLDWEYLRDRFAPFVYESDTETVIFEGMGAENGTVTGAAWQRAITAWARGRYAELATGNASATMHTAMSWHLGQDFSQKNVCMHLTVLNYGYAHAEERMCEGGDVISTAGDWLMSGELTQFDTWLYERATLYSDDNYIDGKGSQGMTEAEVAQAGEWATALWSRIREVSTPTPVAGLCAEPRDGLGTVRNFRLGYCLLVPGDYTVFDVNETTIALVIESLLNVTDPRLNIAVSEAAGRSVDEFADELVVSMAGFEIERSSMEIAGQSAVVLDNVPGQDINRRVLIVNYDRLYDLTFTPMGSADMESFYDTILTDLILVEPES